MKVGFTGTRKGLSAYQTETLIKILTELKPEELHHGDCVGADNDAHHICLELGIRTVIHPPSNSICRAFNNGDSILPTKGYLERNRSIVLSTDLLVACPYEMKYPGKGGTWYIYHYCLEKNKDAFLILPQPE